MTHRHSRDLQLAFARATRRVRHSPGDPGAVDDLKHAREAFAVARASEQLADTLHGVSLTDGSRRTLHEVVASVSALPIGPSHRKTPPPPPDVEPCGVGGPSAA